MDHHDSSITLFVDGDRSGGPVNSSSTEVEILEQAQIYTALAEVYDEGPNVALWPSSRHNYWLTRPPYSDGGGGVFGQKPTITVTEFYVTPFDHLVRDSPTESLVSELHPGTTIGFEMVVCDFDVKPGRTHSSHFLHRGDTMFSNSWIEGFLLGPGGELPDDSAVESVTWARIKAQFVK